MSLPRKDIKTMRKTFKVAQLAMNIGSVAAAIEALEALLVEKGILKDDELMDKLKTVIQKHYEKGEMLPAVDD